MEVVFVAVVFGGFGTSHHLPSAARSPGGQRNSLILRRLLAASFFVWLAFLDRCWIFARLQHHNLQNSGFCALCSQSSETMEHLLVSNVYNWEHWFKLLQSSRKRLHKELHRGFDMFVILVSSVGSAAFRGPRNSPKLHRVPAASFLCG
jgi:hypothetical protein